MLRIFFCFALAACAFYGQWLAEGDQERLLFDNPADAARLTGEAIIAPTLLCFEDGFYSASGVCAPRSGPFGLLVLATVLLATLAGGLSVIGLLPLVGRLTSLVVIAAGIAGVLTCLWLLKDVFLSQTDTVRLADLGLGAIGSALFAFGAVFSGLAGLGGRP